MEAIAPVLLSAASGEPWPMLFSRDHAAPVQFCSMAWVQRSMRSSSGAWECGVRSEARASEVDNESCGSSVQALKEGQVVLKALPPPYELQRAILHPVLWRPHLQVVRGGHGHAVRACTRGSLSLVATNEEMLTSKLAGWQSACLTAQACSLQAAEDGVTCLRRARPVHHQSWVLAGCAACPGSLQTRTQGPPHQTLAALHGLHTRGLVSAGLTAHGKAASRELQLQNMKLQTALLHAATCLVLLLPHRL